MRCQKQDGKAFLLFLLNDVGCRSTAHNATLNKTVAGLSIETNFISSITTSTWNLKTLCLVYSVFHNVLE